MQETPDFTTERTLKIGKYLGKNKEKTKAKSARKAGAGS